MGVKERPDFLHIMEYKVSVSAMWSDSQSQGKCVVLLMKARQSIIHCELLKEAHFYISSSYCIIVTIQSVVGCTEEPGTRNAETRNFFVYI